MKLNLFLYKLENKISRFAVEGLMKIITICMAIVLAADVMVGMFYPEALSINYLLTFDRALIFKGQVWRVLSFIIAYPASSNIFLTLLSLYFFFWTGSAVESYWGKARFNLYYLFGIIGTIAAGFIAGGISNTYLNLSLFLAFAAMFPNQQVLLFFFIPVKVKWIGIAEGLLIAYLLVWAIILKDFATIAAIVAALINFIIFFGYDLINRIKRAYRDYKWRKSNTYNYNDNNYYY